MVINRREALSKVWHYRGVLDIRRSIEIMHTLVPGVDQQVVHGSLSLREVLDTAGRNLADRTLILRPAQQAWPVLWRCLTPRVWEFQNLPSAESVEQDEYLLRLCRTLELWATNDEVFRGEVPLTEDLRFEASRSFGEVAASRLFWDLDA